MKDYKSEVKEILSADKQLAAEIQFDLKKWEEEQVEIATNRRHEEERVNITMLLLVLNLDFQWNFQIH